MNYEKKKKKRLFLLLFIRFIFDNIIITIILKIYSSCLIIKSNIIKKIHIYILL